jgi:hypothetical protein
VQNIFRPLPGQDRFSKGVQREDYNPCGFGNQGVIGPIIGNQSRRSKTIMVHPEAQKNQQVGGVGWGHNNANLTQDIKRRVNPIQYHK